MKVGDYWRYFGQIELYPSVFCAPSLEFGPQVPLALADESSQEHLEMLEADEVFKIPVYVK